MFVNKESTVGPRLCVWQSLHHTDVEYRRDISHGQERASHTIEGEDACYLLHPPATSVRHEIPHGLRESAASTLA